MTPTNTVTARVGPAAIPADTRSLCSLPAIDYGDDFTLTTAGQATPEAWARAALGDVPNWGERCVWRGVLRLRLSRKATTDTVAGWPVTGRGDGWIRLETASWFLGATVIVRTATGQVSLTTLVHYRQFMGRLVWPPISALHRRLVPRLLHLGQARLRAAHS